MKSIIEYLDYWVSYAPNKTVFISLEGSEESKLSYSDLNELVESKHSNLQQFGYEETAILLYDDTIDFISSFLACQRIGIICIPMFYPRNKRHFDRLTKIVESSNSNLVLCATKDVHNVKKSVKSMNTSLTIVSLEGHEKVSECKVVSRSEPISFIQYTSGSTSDPKGVIISQDNLIHNQKMLSEIFRCDSDSVILSWLPFYHDMGLIGSLLHTIYSGCTCVIMKPSAVVGNPLVWLESIQKFDVTHSGGPNFIYDLCNEKICDQRIESLDLSSLKIAYNGSEPVKSKTVEEFVSKFERAGFSKSAYRTCYGLAEATLVVSGGAPRITDEYVSSGELASEIKLAFYNSESNKLNQVSGEICIAGASVTQGYWNIESNEHFVVHKGEKYLKTGDLGTFREDQLVINGRLKEMLIINGENVFPYDLELAIFENTDVLLANGVSLSEEDGQLFVFAELNRSNLKETPEFYTAVRRNINKVLIDILGVESNSIVFVLPRALPRTSSGKIQRTQIVRKWKRGELSIVDSGKDFPANNETFDLENFKWTIDSVELYLISLLKQKMKLSNDTDFDNNTFFELGLSSIKGVELVNQISQDLEIELGLDSLFKLNQLSKVSHYILDIKWLQSNINEDEEIEL